MNKIFSRLEAAFGRDKLIKAAVFLGIIGVILILCCDSPQKVQPSTETAAFSEETERFRCDTEQQLKNILSTIKGVGKAEVMLTVNTTEEYIYAEKTEERREGENKQSKQTEFEIIDSGDRDEALVKKIIVPQISGVVIVCEGGGNSKTCEAVYKSVSTALGIPVSKIYVAKMK